MRKTSWIALAALLAAPTGLQARQNGQGQSAAGQSSQSTQASQTKAPATQQDALAEAARKAREQRKNAPKAATVFTNDNLPTAGGISTVGEETAAAKPEKGKETTAATAAAAPTANNEKAWRDKFAHLRAKLQRDQEELSVMKRELGQQQMQYYSGDPQKAAQDQAGGQPLGEEYNKKRAAIEAKQKQVDADQQSISDAESAMRQAGGDPGWAR